MGQRRQDLALLVSRCREIGDRFLSASTEKNDRIRRAEKREGLAGLENTRRSLHAEGPLISSGSEGKLRSDYLRFR
jgi:hypothetical protein